MSFVGSHPVRLRVKTPPHMAPIQVVIRLALLIAIGAIASSSIYWIAYLTLPAVAAILVSQRGGDRYLGEDGPRIVPALGWFASAYAYLWLLTDEIPGGAGEKAVELEIETGGSPTTGSALWRLLTSVPAVLLL